MSKFATNREDGGRLVCAVKKQEWAELPETDKEADRCIWDAIAAPYIEMINGLYADNARLLDSLYRMQRGSPL